MPLLAYEIDFSQLGIAGALLGVLFWFLRALVNYGVKPFIEATLRNQAALACTMEAIREAMVGTTTALIVLDKRIEGHVAHDAVKSEEIVQSLRSLADKPR